MYEISSYMKTFFGSMYEISSYMKTFFGSMYGISSYMKTFFGSMYEISSCYDRGYLIDDIMLYLIMYDLFHDLDCLTEGAGGLKLSRHLAMPILNQHISNRGFPYEKRVKCKMK